MAKKATINKEKRKKELIEQGKLSACKLTRRCFKCGRPRSVYRDFNLCRICLREMAHRGQIPGLRKASW